MKQHKRLKTEHQGLRIVIETLPMDITRQIEIAAWRLQKHFNMDLNNVGMVGYIKETLGAALKSEAIATRLAILQKYTETLHQLLQVSQVQQRSQEWYNMRKNRLTASDTAQALGLSKYGKAHQLVTKKAFPERFPMTNSMTVAPLRHGVIYESMALRCYTQRHGDIVVHDFGLIPHPRLSCYGASPDGITSQGIMIEIKCPLKRVIDGNVPEHYYLQMQGQMAVCSLNECDYIECDIKETQDENEYLSLVDSSSKVDHGIVLDDNGDLKYSPPVLTPLEAIKWANDTSTTAKKNFWVLRQISIKRVHFDPEKWREYEPVIEDFWKQVEEARLTPYKKYNFIDEDE